MNVAGVEVHYLKPNCCLQKNKHELCGRGEGRGAEVVLNTARNCKVTMMIEWIFYLVYVTKVEEEF